MSNIVETGAVVDAIPFNGKWSPCIRRDGESRGQKVGPLFSDFTAAAKYAADYSRADAGNNAQGLSANLSNCAQAR